jgi:multidrug transporter EmrE-like cation transporter
MFELLIILIAQVFITLADTFVRTQLRTHGKLMFRGAHARDWLLRYLPARFGGLMIRLFALIHVQVGVAATMFAASAVSMSSLVAVMHGEGLTRREWTAVRLIIAAIIFRGIA